MMDLLFVQTGGTIDKDYPRTRGGGAFEITDPAVARILECGNPAFQFEVVSVARKDSLDLTDDDRRSIRDVCAAATATRIVVTHGTDTMIETAEVLAGIAGKVIVLTGAMRPERFSNSDAAFNVGVAIGAAQSLAAGVYVAMHGQVHRWEEVTRNSSGQFVAGERRSPIG
jgi:L-asparaginase